MNTKCKGLPLIKNLLLHMLPFLWTKQKLISLIYKDFSHWHRFYISIMFSLFTHLIKKNWKSSLKVLITTTPTLDLPISSIKKVFPFGTLGKLVWRPIYYRLHITSKDKHYYLHYTSAYPDHTKCSIVFSQALRVNRTSFNKTDFERHLDDIKSWLQASPKHLIQKEMSKVQFNKENSNTKTN